jgi:hypothetical protein
MLPLSFTIITSFINHSYFTRTMMIHIQQKQSLQLIGYGLWLRVPTIYFTFWEGAVDDENT